MISRRNGNSQNFQCRRNGSRLNGSRRNGTNHRRNASRRIGSRQNGSDSLNDHLSGKELFIRFTARSFRKLLLIYVFSYFPFGFEGRISVGTRRQGGVIFSNKPSNKNVRKFSDSH